MEQYTRIQRMILASRLYYDFHKSQNEIAKELEISRPFVSKLLNEAREQGIVTILIKDPLQSETMLEREIRYKYGIKRAFILQDEGKGERLSMVCMMASKFLDSILKPGDIIGVGSGSTMYLCAQKLIARSDLKNTSIVQLDGECRNIVHSTYSQEITKDFSRALGATPYIMPLPVVFETQATRDAVFADGKIQEIEALQHKASIAIFSVADVTHGKSFNLFRQGHLDHERLEKIIQMGARGVLMNRVFDEHGNICDQELDGRTTSMSLHALREKEYKICVAAGRQKIDCVIAALKGGYINVLITDADIAEGLL